MVLYVLLIVPGLAYGKAVSLRDDDDDGDKIEAEEADVTEAEG